MSAILILFLLINFAISWFNAWSVGRGWAETRAMGGFPRFMSWCGATMSACGFTWCYLVIFCLINSLTSGKFHLPDKYAEAVFRIGYLIIILPVLGSGLAITIQSWAYFWKQRSFGSGALAGWNTFAQVYDTYTAIKAIPDSFSFLSGLWEDGDDDDDDAKNKLFLIAVVIAVLCVFGGILTTAAIVRSTAKRVAGTERVRMALLRRAAANA